MAEGLTTDLAWVALVVGAVSFVIARRYLSPAAALGVVLLKVGIPLVYFGWFYDRTWNFLDDVTYWHQGRALLGAGYNPFTVLFRTDGVAMLVQLSLGPHILYGWWNHLAQYLFGPHYFAAVFANVALTFLAAWILSRIARMGGFSESYARGLALYFLLNWELLAWSSFLNAKDIVVLVISISAFFFLIRLVTGASRGGGRGVDVAGLVLMLFLLLFIRFYVSVLILGTFSTWVVMRTRGWKRLALLGGAAVGVVVLMPKDAPLHLFLSAPAAIVYGIVKFALMPRPWMIDASYGFLTVPMVLHWVFFPAAVLGGYSLWRSSRVGALLVLYVMATFLFYAAVPELDSPRYRVQVVFIWAWMQFELLRGLVVWVSRERGERASTEMAHRTG